MKGFRSIGLRLRGGLSMQQLLKPPKPQPSTTSIAPTDVLDFPEEVSRVGEAHVDRRIA